MLFFFFFFKSDIHQIADRLLHCQDRIPLCFRTRFNRASSHELEDRRRDSKIKQNLLPVNRKLTDSQRGSVTDQKLPRTGVSGLSAPKDPANSIQRLT